MRSFGRSIRSRVDWRQRMLWARVLAAKDVESVFALQVFAGARVSAGPADDNVTGAKEARPVPQE